MFVQLNFWEFWLSVFLLFLSLIVARGLREGLYFLTGKVLNQSKDVLIQKTTRQTFSKRTVLFRTGITFLDPFLTWVTIALILFFFLAYTSVQPNLYMRALVVYFTLILGFIYPLRLYTRFYAWLKYMGFKEGVGWWGLYAFMSSGYSILVYYTTLFLVLFLGGPIFLRINQVFDGSMRMLGSQIYIQHVQAFVPMIGLTTIIFLLDIIVYFKKDGSERDDEPSGLY